MHRAGAAAGHPPGRAAAAHAAAARVPEGDGAARLAAHAAQRAAAAVAAGRGHPRAHHEGQHGLGRREDDRHHLLLHARLRLAHRLQAHARRLRVGQGQRGQEQQPQGKRPQF